MQPLAEALRPAATKLAQATPPLTKSVGCLNTLFNTLAYQPKAGEQGYLFWGSWLAHIADNSLANVQDANGPTVRGIFMATCPELNLLETALQTVESVARPAARSAERARLEQDPVVALPARAAHLSRDAPPASGATG